jgi:hypothetical protein
MKCKHIRNDLMDYFEERLDPVRQQEQACILKLVLTAVNSHDTSKVCLISSTGKARF